MADLNSDTAYVPAPAGNARLRRPLVHAASVALLSALSFGLNNGMMNSPAASIRADLGIAPASSEGACTTPSADASSDQLWSLCVSIFSLGALVGCNLWAPQSDRLGRRSFLRRNAVVFIAGAAVEAFGKLGACAPACTGPTWGVGALVLGRAISGVASGASTVVVPLYLAEVSPAAWRGVLLTAFQLGCTVAMLAAQVLGLGGLLGSTAGWPWLLASPLFVSAAQLAAHGWLLESPRWLRASGQPAEARRIETALHGDGGDGMLSGTARSDEVGAASDEAGGGGGGDGAAARPSLRALLAEPRWRRPLGLCCVVMVVQQFSGINNVFNFGVSFLEDNGVAPGVVTAVTVLMNLTNVGVTCLAAWLVDRSGRRPLLLGSSLGMVLAILMLTLALSLSQGGSAGGLASGLAAVSVVSLVGAFGLGQGPVPWMLPTELFPTSARATAGGLAASCNWLANFIVAQGFLSISCALHALAFLPFAACLLCFFAFAWRHLPETRGRTLEQLSREFDGAAAPGGTATGSSLAPQT